MKNNNLSHLQEQEKERSTTKLGELTDVGREWLLQPMNGNTKSHAVTTVFWDLEGFSQLCYKLRAFEGTIGKFLSGYYTLVEDAVHRHGGNVVNWMGDGILATFPNRVMSHQDVSQKSIPHVPFQSALPQDKDVQNSHAISAVSAAVEVRDLFRTAFSKAWNQALQAKVEERIGTVGLKCGINTGEALSGLIQTRRSYIHTIIGNSVNIASRLQALASGSNIVISAKTKDMVSSLFDVRRYGRSSLRIGEGLLEFEYYRVVSQRSGQ